ncbi:endo-1,4-beta-xylanase [uncultured Aquimarina sp.]|uniref:endo-1,4-beta-xylanase n=1 Tax=uncultured Aquimarina sp. TaxID=575652 RepID=UPI0026320862|nr:endo-1,4-beta-xylanase [uncultured Aquimarina sp.]
MKRYFCYTLIGCTFLVTILSFNFLESQGLKDVSSFPIGTAINFDQLKADAKLKKIQIENFNSITAENDMKMYNVKPNEKEYNWDKVDQMMAYAQKNKQRVFGHTLVWHSGTPDWVKEKGRKDTLWLDNFLKEYILDYVGRYKGKIEGWDVVNEALETEGGDYRKTLWYNVLGKNYIHKAFKYAHEADPNAKLFYNDFNIERDTLKLQGVLNMVKDLKSENVPISGIGFQMHIRMDIPGEVIEHALKKAAETGLLIHLSEVDIIFNKHDDTKNGGVQKYQELTEEMKIAQAEKYKNLVDIYKRVVPKEQQYGITFWGFTDRDSWVKSFFKINDWPCLFDDNLEAKPAYHSFKKALH